MGSLETEWRSELAGLEHHPTVPESKVRLLSSDEPLSLTPGDSAMRDVLMGQERKQGSEEGQAENMGRTEGSTRSDQFCCLSTTRAFFVADGRVVRLS